MLNTNNLNRVRGILSAQLGILVPKFLTPAGDTDRPKELMEWLAKKYPNIFGFSTLPAMSLNQWKQYDLEWADHVNGVDGFDDDTRLAFNRGEPQTNLPSGLKGWIQTVATSLGEINLVPEELQEENIKKLNTDRNAKLKAAADEAIKLSKEAERKTLNNLNGVTFESAIPIADRQSSVTPPTPPPAVPAVSTPLEQTDPFTHTMDGDWMVFDNGDAYNNITGETKSAAQRSQEKAEQDKIEADKIKAEKHQQTMLKVGAAGKAVGKIAGIADKFVDKSKFASDDVTVNGVGRQVYDFAADTAMLFGPIGAAIGGGMKVLGLANDLFGSKSKDFSKDQSLENIEGSYGGAASDINTAVLKAGKKYGLFNWSARKKANKAIDKANRELFAMQGISKDALDMSFIASDFEPYNLNYQFNMSGGYDLKYLRAAKLGGTLLLNTFDIKKYDKINCNYAPNFYKTGGILQTDTWLPTIDESEFYWAPNITFEISSFKSGGTVKSPEIEVIEVDTTQKSVIPEGALHKNKHHLNLVGVDDSELTKKGIPVVDNLGDQLAEIELNEIIFTLEVTKELEKRYREYYEEGTKQSRKDEIAIEAGKLLWKEILYNTDDRTGLIDTLKKGGSIPSKPIVERDATYVTSPILKFKPFVLPEFKTFVELKKYLKQTGRDSEEDYDLKAAYADSEVYQTWREEEQKHPGNGHWLDKYKKPNHPTFSTESIYSNSQTPGGEWVESEDGKVYFIPSEYLKSLYSKEFYNEYFKNEPEVTVIYSKKITPKKKHQFGGVLQLEDVTIMVKQALIDLFSKL